ncbi:hypothetical protein P3T18_007050 [Paraburkholderia sp. GAS199]|uniref:hypothetical protein n=1 Tax=Paraburkholderia sp. GAS199 TaxID=3035126 RepID=UPI003D1A3CBD
MSTTFLDMGGTSRAQFSLVSLMKWARVPLAAWSGRRRFAVASLIAVLAFGLGARGWIVADFGGLDASRTALGVANQHLADARQALTQLPDLRRRSQAVPTLHLPASWTSADDLRLVSELAAQNGVALLSVEPGVASGAGADAARPIQLAARTDFVHLMSFLRGLSDLPVLVVPGDVTVKRADGLLVISATLSVYSGLNPAPLADDAQVSPDDSVDADDEEVVFYDPFSLVQMQASNAFNDTDPLRLAGLLRDRTRALALLETPDGTRTASAGQQVGGEHITRFDASGITLANGDATRTLSLAEAS